MIIKGDEYASKATGQQTSDTTILATRGSIVDRNGADLAISATTHTIWVRPDEVRDNGKTDEENLGFTYAMLDKYIRGVDDLSSVPEIKEKIDRLHRANLHKLMLMPKFELNK